MLATIVKAEMKESTEQWPNPDAYGNRKYWMTLDFRPHGVVPDFGGLGANDDGTIRGQMGCKSYTPVPGAIIDVDVRPNDRRTVLNFKRLAPAQGVPMNGQPKANGHAAPTSNGSRSLTPVIPEADKATFLEFAARYTVALGVMKDAFAEHFKGLPENEVARLCRDAMGPFVVEWLREHGCQMPNLMDGGIRGYQSAGDEDSTSQVPF